MNETIHNEGCAFTVVKAWKKRLAGGGYEPPHLSRSLKIKITYLSRTWRRILRHTGFKLTNHLTALELGCGGGAQLIPLFANGWTCVGVDCSSEVLLRAKQYANDIIEHKLLKSDRGKIKFIHDDFLNFRSNELFDIAFQFGVLEHFFYAEERLMYMRKMFEAVKPGGYAVNFVPNGQHPLRKTQKSLRLGGYEIPEIDYSSELLKKEMLNCGASSAYVLTHDLMGYFKLQERTKIQKILSCFIYLIFQLPLFQRLPLEFRHRHAFWLIGIGKK